MTLLGYDSFDRLKEAHEQWIEESLKNVIWP